MKKRIASLQDEMTLLQNDVDRLEERLASVEARPSVQPRTSDQEKAKAGTLERPRLKVIKLEPGGSPPDAQPIPEESVSEAKDTEEPRPVIRGSGDRIESELPSAPKGRDHG